jgi:hypothetical protein
MEIGDTVKGEHNEYTLDEQIGRRTFIASYSKGNVALQFGKHSEMYAAYDVLMRAKGKFIPQILDYNRNNKLQKSLVVTKTVPGNTGFSDTNNKELVGRLCLNLNALHAQGITIRPIDLESVRCTNDNVYFTKFTQSRRAPSNPGFLDAKPRFHPRFKGQLKQYMLYFAGLLATIYAGHDQVDDILSNVEQSVCNDESPLEVYSKITKWL